MMKIVYKSLKAAVLISLLVLAFTGCASQTVSNTNVTNVKTAEAEKHKLQTSLDLAGVLVPAQTVNIASKISGQIVEMNYNVGDSVKAGETLVRIETKALNAQMLQAEAGLQSAKASEQAAENQAALAKINLDTAQKLYDKTKVMYDAGATSQTQMDDITSKLDLAKKQYENASGSAKAQAMAAVSTANANINSVRVQMENAVIKSPINGVIVNKNISTGEIASPTLPTPILTIADTSILKLKGTVAQEMLPLLKQGQDINVIIDIYPDKTFKGKIESIGPMAVSTGTFFPIEISIENSGDIKAGLSAHASVDIAEEKGVVVPASAVVQNNGESYVFVIENNVAAKRIVTTGLKNEKEIEILNGLTAGEKVAVTNVNSLFDKMPVNVN